MRKTTLVKEYIQYQTGREVTKNTLISEMNSIKLLNQFNPVTYESIRNLTVQDARYIISELEKRLAGSSMRTFKGNIAGLFNFVAIDNPFKYAKLKVAKRGGDEAAKIIQPNELGEMFSKFDDLKLVEKVVVQIYFNTGLRNEELVNCDRDDYNAEKKTLRLSNTKTSECEYVELSNRTCSLLDEYLQQRRDRDSSLIVTAKFMKRMGKKTTLKIVKNFSSNVERATDVRMVRRTVSSILLANGVSENDTEDRLRHKKMGTVGRSNYQKKVNVRMYELAEKMDEIIQKEVKMYKEER